MRVNANIDINELLPALERYRQLYWEDRAHELESYLAHARMDEQNMTDDEIDEFWDRFHGRCGGSKDWLQHRTDLVMAEAEVMRIMRGESPDEVTKLQDEVLHECGE